MDFHAMKRKELQALCKQHKIPANLSNVEMANRLSSLLKVEEEESTEEEEAQSFLEETGIGGSRDEVKKGSIKRAKKVKFSPQNETFVFERTDPRAMRLATRKTRLSIPPQTEDRLPRTKAKKNAGVATEAASSCGGVDDDVIVVVSHKNNTSKRNTRYQSEKDREEEEEVAEAEPILRRSRRTMSKKDSQEGDFVTFPVKRAGRSSRKQEQENGEQIAKGKEDEMDTLAAGGKGRCGRQKRNTKAITGKNTGSVVEHNSQRRSTRNAAKISRIAPDGEKGSDNAGEEKHENGEVNDIIVTLDDDRVDHQNEPSTEDLDVDISIDKNEHPELAGNSHKRTRIQGRTRKNGANRKPSVKYQNVNVFPDVVVGSPAAAAAVAKEPVGLRISAAVDKQLSPVLTSTDAFVEDRVQDAVIPEVLHGREEVDGGKEVKEDGADPIPIDQDFVQPESEEGTDLQVQNVACNADAEVYDSLAQEEGIKEEPEDIQISSKGSPVNGEGSNPRQEPKNDVNLDAELQYVQDEQMVAPIDEFCRDVVAYEEQISPKVEETNNFSPRVSTEINTDQESDKTASPRSNAVDTYENQHSEVDFLVGISSVASVDCLEDVWNGTPSLRESSYNAAEDAEIETALADSDQQSGKQSRRNLSSEDEFVEPGSCTGLSENELEIKDNVNRVVEVIEESERSNVKPIELARLEIEGDLVCLVDQNEYSPSAEDQDAIEIEDTEETDKFSKVDSQQIALVDQQAILDDNATVCGDADCELLPPVETEAYPPENAVKLGRQNFIVDIEVDPSIHEDCDSVRFSINEAQLEDRNKGDTVPLSSMPKLQFPENSAKASHEGNQLETVKLDYCEEAGSIDKVQSEDITGTSKIAFNCEVNQINAENMTPKNGSLKEKHNDQSLLKSNTESIYKSVVELFTDGISAFPESSHRNLDTLVSNTLFCSDNLASSGVESCLSHFSAQESKLSLISAKASREGNQLEKVQPDYCEEPCSVDRVQSEDKTANFKIAFNCEGNQMNAKNTTPENGSSKEEQLKQSLLKSNTESIYKSVVQLFTDGTSAFLENYPQNSDTPVPNVRLSPDNLASSGVTQERSQKMGQQQLQNKSSLKLARQEENKFSKLDANVEFSIIEGSMSIEEEGPKDVSPPLTHALEDENGGAVEYSDYDRDVCLEDRTWEYDIASLFYSGTSKFVVDEKDDGKTIINVRNFRAFDAFNPCFPACGGVQHEANQRMDKDALANGTHSPDLFLDDNEDKDEAIKQNYKAAENLYSHCEEVGGMEQRAKSMKEVNKQGSHNVEYTPTDSKVEPKEKDHSIAAVENHIETFHVKHSDDEFKHELFRKEMPKAGHLDVYDNCYVNWEQEIVVCLARDNLMEEISVTTEEIGSAAGFTEPPPEVTAKVSGYHLSSIDKEEIPKNEHLDDSDNSYPYEASMHPSEGSQEGVVSIVEESHLTALEIELAAGSSAPPPTEVSPNISRHHISAADEEEIPKDECLNEYGSSNMKKALVHSSESSLQEVVVSLATDSLLEEPNDSLVEESNITALEIGFAAGSTAPPQMEVSPNISRHHTSAVGEEEIPKDECLYDSSNMNEALVHSSESSLQGAVVSLATDSLPEEPYVTAVEIGLAAESTAPSPVEVSPKTSRHHISAADEEEILKDECLNKSGNSNLNQALLHSSESSLHRVVVSSATDSLLEEPNVSGTVEEIGVTTGSTTSPEANLNISENQISALDEAEMAKGEHVDKSADSDINEAFIQPLKGLLLDEVVNLAVDSFVEVEQVTAEKSSVGAGYTAQPREMNSKVSFTHGEETHTVKQTSLDLLEGSHQGAVASLATDSLVEETNVPAEEFGVAHEEVSLELSSHHLSTINEEGNITINEEDTSIEHKEEMEKFSEKELHGDTEGAKAKNLSPWVNEMSNGGSTTILIHATPTKKTNLQAGDMKENETTSVKRAQLANATAVRPRRKPLEELNRL